MSKLNRKFNRIAGFILAVMIAFLFPATIHADAEEAYQFTLGNVQIELNETELKDGKEVPLEDVKTIVPGEQVSEIVRVKNFANSAWIRIQATLRDADGNEKEFPRDHFLGLDKDTWVQRGEYWYYKKPADKNEEILFITGIATPATWSEDNSGSEYHVTFSADAIQSDNFTPDFNAKEPWYGQKIIDHQDEADKKNTARKLTIHFENGAEKYVSVDSDFIASCNTMMPGDVISGMVNINNTEGKTFRLFFRTRNNSLSKLDDAVKLTISYGDIKVFEGNFSDIVQNTEIGVFKPGASGALKYTLSVPKELDNTFSLTDISQDWYFRTEIQQENETTNDIPTGDNMKTGIIVIAGIAIILLMLANKERKRDHEKE